ncbi:MAG TPA: serine hydrolase domain-containing protein [Dehalococcoidia bacterium]|jgi:CubicO group peptidase (beta-lactamase class C family)|nr:serine hydrolase domain-containing protein [Dehalococcoidia bacterium]
MAMTVDRMIETEPEDVGLSSARLENVTRVVHRAVDEGRIPGGMTLVGRHGKVAYFDTYGSADLEAGKPLAEDTIFRIYSMTKPIVSVALMTLYEEGLFQIDEPVSKYIPQLKGLKVFAGGTAEAPILRDATREMNIRDILSHTSGLAGGPGDANAVAQMYRARGIPGLSAEGATLAGMVEKLGQVPLVFDPGTQWLYSIATNVVGHLAEVLSGQPLDRFLEERIFRPLGMVDSGFHVPAEKVSRFAANYERDDAGRLKLLDAPGTSNYLKPQTFFSGTGGLVSTMQDYTQFARMLANGGELDGARIIGPRTLQYMASNHLDGGKDMATMSSAGYSEISRWGQGFGLGFSVLMDSVLAGTIGTVGEYGWSGAAGTTFFISPGEDMFAVFMTQLMRAQPLRRELRTTIYGAIVD